MRRLSSAFAAIGLCAFVAGCAEPAEPDDLQQGIDAFNRNQYAAAMEIFQAEERQDAKNPYVEFNIARTYAATGNRDDAIRYYKKVLIDGQDVFLVASTMGYRGKELAAAACDRLIGMGVGCE
jgi:tetratricopeptide (TPR) repeat protein